jgi:PAS domain S-box-containing protein
MILKWMRQLGILKTTLATTAVAIFASFFLYSGSSFIIAEAELRGVLMSLIIPAIIAPIFGYIFAYAVIKLHFSEEALKQSGEKYRTILNNVEDGYFEVDIAGNFTFFNDSMSRLIGYSPSAMTGMNNREYMDAENAKKVFQTFNRVYETGKPAKGFDWELTAVDGSKRQVDASLSLITDNEDNRIGFRGIARDITGRKQAAEEKERLENQLQQAQKMEAIGTLAGGIAHDFNNILSVIIGYTELILMNGNVDSEVKQNLKEIFNASKHARDMVKQILAFSRQNKQERKPIQVSHIVKEAIRMLRASLPTTIAIEQKIEKNIGIIEADPTQIHQVLMNLCTNAAHAINEKDGILEISLNNIELDQNAAARHPELKPGSYLKLSVRDTGDGIHPDAHEKIFNPYFTTKEKGEGTGLGLAVVQGIIKSHNGAVTVESEVGQGSTFHVYLPTIPREATTDELVSAPLPMGHEYILLVDDEQPLAEIGKQMLERLGYTVAARTSSIEALELFKAKPNRFDLVITDIVMPNMTGEKLAEKLMEIRADIPVVLCTGYSEKFTRRQASEIGVRSFLMKPLVMQDLASTVRQALAAN